MNMSLELAIALYWVLTLLLVRVSAESISSFVAVVIKFILT